MITPAVGFPTTVAPLYQHGLVPVYVDVEPDTYNPSLEAFAAAIGPRTRGDHGRPLPRQPVRRRGPGALCAEHGLVLIEDCCDALGSRSAGASWARSAQAATYSFYPAHHMTTGEGGAVACDDAPGRARSSLREWGRDCWCPPGRDDVCGRRFEGRFGGLPEGYDHKYVFSTRATTSRSPTCRPRSASPRRSGWGRSPSAGAPTSRGCDAALEPLADRLVLPRSLPGAEPLWFGFPLTLRDGGAAERAAAAASAGPARANRGCSGGNMTLQPGFRRLVHRVAGPLAGADRITAAAIWVGCPSSSTTRWWTGLAESVVAAFRKNRLSP